MGTNFNNSNRQQQLAMKATFASLIIEAMGSSLYQKRHQMQQKHIMAALADRQTRDHKSLFRAH
jgi:hypothetical protein